MEEIKRREQLSERFTNEEEIHAYLHPRERGRTELFLRVMKPVFQKKPTVIHFILNGIAGGMVPVLGAFFIRFLVDAVTKLTEKKIAGLSEAAPLLLTVGAFSFFILFFLVLSSQIEGRVRAKLTSIRIISLVDIMYKVSCMDLSLLEDARFKNSMGRYHDAVSGSSNGMEGIFNRTLTSLKYFVSFLIFSFFLWRVSPVIPVFGVLTILLTAFSGIGYSRYVSETEKEKVKIDRKFTALASESQDFSYGKDIRLFGLRGAFKSIGEKLLKTQTVLVKRLFKKYALYQIPVAISFSLLELLTLFFVYEGHRRGSIGIPDAVMILSLGAFLTVQIGGITDYFKFLYEELVVLRFFYDVEDAVLTSEGGREMKLSEFPHFDLVLQDVWFKYPGSDSYVLQGINLTVKEGETLALVGVNGAGKTTLTNLVNGLYMPTKGKITLGGIDINELSRKTLNELITIVFQDFEPIALTVKENVSCIKKETGEIDEARVEESLKKAGIYEKISASKKGIHGTMLRVIEEDGLVLSGGENQKLSIARALYKEGAGLMIMDEPTSALDALAEEKIYQEFNDIIGEKSAIFISHRLASTRFCDKIALLNGGEITEIGTHEELLQKDGLYMRMFETQASYYKEG